MGKTTLCMKLRDEKNFGYVSLRDYETRKSARDDPKMFLQTHPWPLIIDEIQYAPNLFEIIESVVDQEKVDHGTNKGMYVLTGSQAYKLMKGITDSLAGRIALIHMSPLSMSEVFGREEIPFTVDLPLNIKRSMEYSLSPKEFFARVIRGNYPELTVEPELSAEEYYSDYVSSYLDRDVSEIIQVRHKDQFHSFMQLLASLTGQELNYEMIASSIGIDGKTVKEWISVLISGDIIHLLQPYSDRSTVKRIVKRPKLYFWDTGLACHLARVLDPESLAAGYLKGPMVETFIVDEILKTYRNARMESPFYYYRDRSGNEIDPVMVKSGKVSLIECKSGTTFGWNDIKAVSKGIPSQYPMGGRCIICLTEKAYPINKDVYALPVTCI